jgi:hypothetical protein
MNIPGYRTEAEQAERLGVTTRTLAGWRAQRKGPRWVKLGQRVLYPDDADIEWLKANEQRPVREERRRQYRTAAA